MVSKRSGYRHALPAGKQRKAAAKGGRMKLLKEERHQRNQEKCSPNHNTRAREENHVDGAPVGC
jgi:hypothetical protein